MSKLPMEVQAILDAARAYRHEPRLSLRQALFEAIDAYEGVAPALSLRDAALLGGETTKRRHGVEHYRAAGRKGGKRAAERLGRDHFVSIGRKGGLRRAEEMRLREGIRKENGTTTQETEP